jgi:hypothetical protein
MSFVFLVLILVSLQSILSLPITTLTVTTQPLVMIGTLSHTTVPQSVMIETLSRTTVPQSVMIETLSRTISSVTVPQPAVIKTVQPKSWCANNEITTQLHRTESNIDAKIVEKSLVTTYNNKLIEEFNTLMRSDDVMYRFRWQVLSEVVKKIMDDKETLNEILKQDNGFGYAYDEHYVRNKKAFSLFSSKYDSFCASLIMGRYH